MDEVLVGVIGDRFSEIGIDDLGDRGDRHPERE